MGKYCTIKEILRFAASSGSSFFRRLVVETAHRSLTILSPIHQERRFRISVMSSRFYGTRVSSKWGLGTAAWCNFSFDSGQNVTFVVPANQGGLLTEIVQDDSLKMRNLQLVFDQFLLTPIDAETLAMADWSIWQRWELAFKTGKADMNTHPALPHEAMRHAELKPILDRTLVTNPEKAITKIGRFEPLGEQTLPMGVLRTLQVKWTAPLTNLIGTLRTMRFPNENDE